MPVVQPKAIIIGLVVVLVLGAAVVGGALWTIKPQDRGGDRTIRR